MLSQDLDQDLLHGSAQDLADLLGCSTRTIRRYKAGTLPLPEPSRRLLRLRRNGDLEALLGSDWAGFSFDAKGLLFAPGWRNGFRPDQIRAMFFVFQEAAALRSDVRRLRAGHRATDLEVLRNLVALQVSNDGNGSDDAECNILWSGH